jgi:hypothetical protein
MPSHALNDTDLASLSIFLHSNDAVISISDAEKIFYLKESVFAPPGYRIIVGLTNLTMPNSMYNIVDGKNTITINDTEYTITAGNYSAEGLKDALNTALSGVATCAFDDVDSNFSFTFDSGSGTINSSTMERQLGLRQQLPVAVSGTYTATGICDLGGVTNIYIRVRNLTMNNLDSRGKTSNIIASIVNNTNYGGYIFFVPPEVLYYQINETSISHLDIELTDQEGNVIDLNGADFNLTLTIHYVKQRESSFKNSLLREIKEKLEMKNGEQEKKNDK